MIPVYTTVFGKVVSLKAEYYKDAWCVVIVRKAQNLKDDVAISDWFDHIAHVSMEDVIEGINNPKKKVVEEPKDELTFVPDASTKKHLKMVRELYREHYN
jgi:hypothetical protein